MSYIEPYELIFTNDPTQGINTGGISVKSILMGKGISPIRTLNGGGEEGDNVSDLFGGANIVVPNWAFTDGIKRNSLIEQHKKNKNESDEDSDEDSVVAGDLHDKLLGLIEETDSHTNNNKNNTNNTNNTNNINKQNNKNTKKGGKGMKTKGKTKKLKKTKKN